MKMRSLDEVNIRDVFRILRQKYLYILGITFGAGLFTWILCSYILPQTYRASFSFYAWEGANKVQVLTSPDTSLFYRNVVFSEKLLNDYQKILTTRTFRKNVAATLKEVFPELEGYSYSTAFTIGLTSHFIECEIFSHSPEKAVAVGYIMSETFKDSILQLMNLQKVQVFSEPQLDKEVYSPKSKFITVLVTIIALLGSFLYFFFLDFFRDLIVDPDKMVTSLGIPLLGTLSVQHGTQKGQRTLVSRENAARYHYDVLYENFQLVLSNLRYSIAKKKDALVFLMTSIIPGEGKSFVSSNLAMLLAEKEKRVLLIGCDVRKPTLHEFFELERGIGLVNVLLGEIPFEQAVHHNVCGIQGLDLLISGPIPPNPVKILELFRSSTFLDTVKKDYDYILLDAPPSIEIADVFMLGPLSDGVIFVIKYATCPAFIINRALDKMRSMNLNLLGGILNFFDMKKSGYGYGYGYGYYEDGSGRHHSKDNKKSAEK